jgi:hypothetical protein
MPEKFKISKEHQDELTDIEVKRGRKFKKERHPGNDDILDFKDGQRRKVSLYTGESYPRIDELILRHIDGVWIAFWFEGGICAYQGTGDGSPSPMEALKGLNRCMIHAREAINVNIQMLLGNTIPQLDEAQ